MKSHDYYYLFLFYNNLKISVIFFINFFFFANQKTSKHAHNKTMNRTRRKAPATWLMPHTHTHSAVLGSGYRNRLPVAE